MTWQGAPASQDRCWNSTVCKGAALGPWHSQATATSALLWAYALHVWALSLPLPPLPAPGSAITGSSGPGPPLLAVPQAASWPVTYPSLLSPLPLHSELLQSCQWLLALGFLAAWQHMENKVQTPSSLAQPLPTCLCALVLLLSFLSFYGPQSRGLPISGPTCRPPYLPFPVPGTSHSQIFPGPVPACH